MKRNLIAGIALALLCTLAITGCAPSSKATTEKLMGSWFDDRSGAEYRFVSDSMLVVPHEQGAGGNAVPYSVLGADRLDIRMGEAHRVSLIEKLTGEQLVLADPVSGNRQLLYRDRGRTVASSELASAAVEHLQTMSTVMGVEPIVFVAPEPKGKASSWTKYSPSSLDAYAAGWDWTKVKKTKRSAEVTGFGSAVGYSFTVERVVPSQAAIEASSAAVGSELVRGSRFIEVGYSPSKADYPAGTLLYLPGGGLVYCLGDGYGIGVLPDVKSQGFIPITHD
jgi:hypothetical protein